MNTKKIAMKKKRLIIFILAAAAVVAAATILLFTGRELPADPELRYGKLPNGMTYYIRHNAQPAGRADFYIVQRVGSMQEEDNQRGLAHFLEHMAFNGSARFPDKSMIDYLETIGVKFGQGLNAYTGFDETVYSVSGVPVARSGIVDSCLMILHDWSGFLSLTEEAMLRERGVIREEMRTRNSASFRQSEALLPVVMEGSKYAHRMPIGTEEVIMNFNLQELADYYRKWYRPDLQAIVIVGDIDARRVEERVKSMFADIPKPEDPAERVYYPVPGNDSPIVAIATDPEATFTEVTLCFKHPRIDEKHAAGMRGATERFMRQAVVTMLTQRLSELAMQPDPPFSGAVCSDKEFIVARTTDALCLAGGVRDGQVERTLKALAGEIERARRYGFTETEYERARAGYLKSFEDAYNERDKYRSQTYTQLYVHHFTRGGALTSVEKDYEVAQKVARKVTLGQVNDCLARLAGERDVVIMLTAPQKEGLDVPGKERLLAWFGEAQSAELAPYVDRIGSKSLVAQEPAPGSITSETADERFGTTVFTLSNGARVVLKTTDLRNNEILFAAVSPGGSSLFPADDPVNAKLFNALAALGGLGDFNPAELTKYLTGKSAQVSVTMTAEAEGLAGACTPKDLETMLQLVYLNFTAPRKDLQLARSTIDGLRTDLEDQRLNPKTALSDSLAAAMYRYPTRFMHLNPADLDEADYEKIMRWRADRFGDAGDFTFIFTGNLDAAQLRPLAEKYLASLPAVGRREQPRDAGNDLRTGQIRKSFSRPMRNPTTTVINAYWGTIAPTPENILKMSFLRNILQIVYTEKVRTEQSGTYGVAVSGNISSFPAGQAVLQMIFDTNAAQSEQLNRIIQREMEEIAQYGPRPQDFGKVRELARNVFAENRQKNAYWINLLKTYYTDGSDGYTGLAERLEALTPADIQLFAGELLRQGNHLELIMTGVPEKQAYEIR